MQLSEVRLLGLRLTREVCLDPLEVSISCPMLVGLRHFGVGLTGEATKVGVRVEPLAGEASQDPAQDSGSAFHGLPRTS